MNDYKKNIVCQSCKNLSVNIYGQYCTRAHYESSSYGSFFKSNDCVFDELNRQLKPLFEPVPEEAKVKLSELQLKMNQIEREHNLEVAKLENALRTLLNKENKS